MEIHSEPCLDPGFGCSNVEVCITELADGLVTSFMVKSIRDLTSNKMINTTVRLRDEYGTKFGNRCRNFVDGANPSFIRALKARVS